MAGKGRPFQKGRKKTGGRKQGSLNRPSMKKLYLLAVEEGRDKIRASLKRKLEKGDFHHIKLAAEYLDGKPVARMEIETPQAIQNRVP